MRHAMSLLLATAVLGLAACTTTTTFKPLDVKGESIYVGRGGTRSVQDGMDIWVDGDPPRRYRVLGIINDQRFNEAKPMSQLPSDVVKEAREVGGQALIRFSTRSEVIAYKNIDGTTSGTAQGTAAAATGGATATPIRRNTALFLVIQYVD